jgi:hypothetical protein
MKGITPAQRVVDLNACAAKLNQYLIETNGVVLSGKLRWAVMQCARDALVKCKGCASLGQDVCLAPGSVFDVIADIDHDPDFPLPQQAKATETLKTLVHTLIHHQTQLDDEWYQKTIKALGKTNLVPGSAQGESRRSLLCSLLAEVVLLTTMSHATHIIFLAIGREIPPLPAFDDMKHLKPSLLDISSLLREGANIREDLSLCAASFVLYKDLDPLLLERVASPEECVYLSKMLKRFPPALPMGFAPHDMFMMGLFRNGFLFGSINPFTCLDPNKRCTDNFTRFDQSTCSLAVASAYDCGF